MFDISVEDPTASGHIHVWQNSWAFSSRVLGVMVMIHGDDQGLGLPTRGAQIQTVIVPVGVKKSTSPKEKQMFMGQIEDIAKKLKLAVQYLGTQGAPLRVEFGLRDAAGGVISHCRRDTGEKGTIAIENISAEIPEPLEQIQNALDEKNVLLIPFCLEKHCEQRTKELTTRQDMSHVPEERRPPNIGTKSLCISFEQPGGLGHSTKCLSKWP
ncbi:unnamed protein product [Clonostachys solani]|uniref:Proline-tRNA ligase class II C-terminal domain-containing protein n=1 Tax=Clonostachys solani TaxID=160281 RepID=A0A9N9YYR9_9HYPO|nr:unnamed protein product [Clonostachys solani]